MAPPTAPPPPRADLVADNEAARRESLARDSLMFVAVGGMHSRQCEERIVAELSGVAGVREVEVDFPSGTASVIYDARRVTAHQLSGVIVAAGYRCADPTAPDSGG